MNPKSDLDPQLETLLDTLRRTAPRDPQRASRARETFLAKAAQMTPTVSFSPRNRLDEWKATFKSIWFVTRKEKTPMFNFVMTLALVLGAVLGSGATTVAAAQTAQPEEMLYPVKTWSEDVRMGWETDQQAKFDLVLQFTTRRAEEIETMLATGSVVPEPVVTRFASQQQMAIQFAANLPDELALPALKRVHDQAQQQEQAMQQLQLTDPACEQLRDRIQAMLQSQAQTAQTGLEDPDQLRDQLRIRDHDRLHLDTPTVMPSETGEATVTDSNPTATDTSTPSSNHDTGEAQNPWTDETPTPGSGYGPGASQNPWTDGTPTPGSSYGPGTGTGDCLSCTPQPNNGSPTDQPAFQSGNGSGSNRP